MQEIFTLKPKYLNAMPPYSLTRNRTKHSQTERNILITRERHGGPEYDLEVDLMPAPVFITIDPKTKLTMVTK